MSLAVDLGVYVIIATALVAAGGLVWASGRRRRALARVGHMSADIPVLGSVLGPMVASLSPGKRRLKLAMLVGAAMLCAVAVARPGKPGEVVSTQRGIDVVVVMDYSASMLARDVYPNRLVRMNEEVEALLDRLGTDRVGVVVFAGAAAHFPLTHDHLAARSLFRGLTVRDLPPGSDLGAGIRTARCVLRPGLVDDPGCMHVGGRGSGGEPRDGWGDGSGDARGDSKGEGAGKEAGKLADRARAMVVFTDGEDTFGQVAPEVERALLLGVEVYLVGVGTAAGELVPELDGSGKEIGWKKTEDGKSFVTTKLDVEGLGKLAAMSGGQDRLLLASTDEFVTSALVARLRELERGDLEERKIRRHQDLYHWFLFPALMLLVAEACSSARRRRVVYSIAGPRDSAPPVPRSREDSRMIASNHDRKVAS